MSEFADSGVKPDVKGATGPRPSARFGRRLAVTYNAFMKRTTVCTLWILLAACIPALACTNFMATDGRAVWFGDSEDAGMGHPLEIDPESAVMFFFPGVNGTYGRMHLGWLWQGTRNSYQAGMNDQGLAYGLTAVPNVELLPHPERPYRRGRDEYFDRLLATCVNVDDAIEYAYQFDAEAMWFQIMFADASGAAAVIGPGPDGELAVTRKDAHADVFVASTFNLSDSTQYVGRDAFVRYDDAVATLTESVDENMLDAAEITRALDIVHREGAYGLGQSYTMYSTAYDLENCVAYTYFMSQFGEAVRTDLTAELARGRHTVRLTDLFSSETRDRAFARYLPLQRFGKTVMVAEIAALAALLGAVAFWLGSLLLDFPK